MQAAQTIPNSSVSPIHSSSFSGTGSSFSQTGSSLSGAGSSLSGAGSSLSGTIGNLMARVFGCRHAEMSRPFSRDGRAYRSCLNCGAQRQFNLGNWEMQGRFYYGQPQ
jgi:hypothetical protein